MTNKRYTFFFEKSQFLPHFGPILHKNWKFSKKIKNDPYTIRNYVDRI